MSKGQNGSQLKKKKRGNGQSNTDNDGGHEAVLRVDIRNLIQAREAANEATSNSGQLGLEKLPDRFSQIEVSVEELSSTGDGLGVLPGTSHVIVVPFTLPGDVVQAKIINHFPREQYSLADFLSVTKPSADRDESLVKCQYFASCGGCQHQMLDYQKQLNHKKNILEKAYRHFSNLSPEVIPPVLPTIGSPLEYGYRTKLTPHFDGPPGALSRRRRAEGTVGVFDKVPPIGFQVKGMRRTIDVEDCPIGTDAVRAGLKAERGRVAQEIAQYRKGATLLLRENTVRKMRREKSAEFEERAAVGEEAPADPKPDLKETGDKGVVADTGQEKREATISLVGSQSSLDKQERKDSEDIEPRYIDIKTCITDQNATATEYVNDWQFRNTAGAFFQNNNSILPRFVAYIRDCIIGQTVASHNIADTSTLEFKYLIDAYCGSGLFTITLSDLFSASLGIDIAEPSIIAARNNARINGIENANFMTADAARIFDKVSFPGSKTVVVIDPPRKGCDEQFLRQLLRFAPQRIVYVSCNVHTQARDIGLLVQGRDDCHYRIDSLQGFDFFPQTGHVEGVAMLSRVDTVS